MGAGKDMWIAEVERIYENFGDGKLTEQEAIDDLVRMGFDMHEAQDQIQTIAAEQD